MQGVHWVRVLYCYPDTVEDALLDEIAATPRWRRIWIFPAAHRRRPSQEHEPARLAEWIRDRVAACKARGITLRTTMIVGFPGETQAQFAQLLRFVKEAEFDRLGAFAYSREEDTVGATLPGQVSQEVKQRRLDQLMTLQQGISLQLNQRRVGEVCEVLCEGEEDGQFVGRSIREAPESDGVIRFRCAVPVGAGAFVSVKITGRGRL